MLRPAERALVAREPGLAGLACLLDADAFAGELARAAPGLGIEALTPVYLRYKPETRCLVTFTARLEGAPAPLPLYATAHGADFDAKLARYPRFSPELAGPAGVAFRIEERRISVHLYPSDARLASLSRLLSSEPRRRLLARLAPHHPELWGHEPRLLAYKPERRAVLALEHGGVASAVLKLYTPAGFWRAHTRLRAFEAADPKALAPRLGRSQRHAALCFEWMAGELLEHHLASGELVEPSLSATGSALAELHARRIALPPRSRDAAAQRVMRAAEELRPLLPGLERHARSLAARIAGELCAHPQPCVPIHGDFYAKQVIVTSRGPVLLDLDQSELAPAGTDLGSFRAHLEQNVIRGRLDRARADEASAALLSGYTAVAGRAVPNASSLFAAAELMAIAVHHFRRLEPDWDARIAACLERADQLLRQSGERSRARLRAPVHPCIPSSEPRDPSMPVLDPALDPKRAGPILARALGHRGLELRRATLQRHRPGRRALVAYDVVRREGDAVASHRWLAKLRARGPDRGGPALAEALRAAGFHPGNQDAIAVPRPVGLVRELHAWLQEHVPGRASTHLLAGPAGPGIARRVADAVHKLQRSGVSSPRLHTLGDELAILRSRLGEVGRQEPRLADRIRRVLVACEKLVAALPPRPPVTAHRDFYPDHVLVQGPRLWIIDWDLCCRSHPALDIANFSAHVMEQALRVHGDPGALLAVQQQLEDGFLEGAEASLAADLAALRSLSLARHIAIAARIEARRPWLGDILELCEQTLDLAPRGLVPVLGVAS